VSINLPGPYLEIPKGDARNFTLQIIDNNGEPYDLTNSTEITFIVVESDTEGAAAVFSCTLTGADITIVGVATDGTIKVAVVATDTSSATAGEKVWEVEVQESASGPFTTEKGNFNILQSHVPAV
jgi:hypothetical protein